MKLVYTAENLIDAKIVSDILESQSIESTLLNTNLSGAVGEIPFTQVFPEVWITDDEKYNDAKNIISDYGEESSKEEYVCSYCNEDVPSNFSSCWNCGLPI